MKKIILIGVIAVALQGCGQAEEKDVASECNSLATLAESIMKARQSGVSISELTEALENKAMAVTIAAYDIPMYSDEESKMKAIEDFREEGYLQCLKEFNK